MNDMTSFRRKTSKVGIGAFVSDGTPVTKVDASIFSARPDTGSHAVRNARVSRPRLTNDESTWTNPVSASKDDERKLRSYLPRLCNAYIFEKEGGRTEVELRVKGRELGHHIWGSLVFKADNRTRNGRLVENKVAVANGGGRSLIQLTQYLRYLEQNGGSLDYCFFSNPAGSLVGPTTKFALMLADAATKYDLGIRIVDHEWWEELQ
jgi:hypothetical protein